MKKFIFICTLFTGVFCHPLFAQDDSLLVDSIEPEIGIAQMFDSCYKNLNLDYATTGLLIDKAIPTINVQAYSGLTGDTILSDNFAWRRAYGTLRRAFIDSTEAFDTLEKVIGLMEAYQDSGYMPIGIINYQYNRIKSTAIEDSLIYVSGIQLFDVSGRTESPYEIKPCFMAAPYIHESDTEIVTFVFNPAMYFTNDTRTLDHLEVDFGNGTDHILAWGDTITIVFDSTYTEGISLDLFFTDESSLSGHFTMEVNKTLPNLGPYNNPPDIANWALAHEEISDQLVVSVRFGCGNNSGHIRKPFIVLDGYGDPCHSGFAIPYKLTYRICNPTFHAHIVRDQNYFTYSASFAKLPERVKSPRLRHAELVSASVNV